MAVLLQKLEQQTGRTRQELLNFARSAGYRYKVFTIEKRNGGVRTIEQPSKSVKSLQRWLMHAVIRNFPIHNSAMGYREGISIRDNALSHAKYPFTIRMDFKDFFWSFKRQDIIDFFSLYVIPKLPLSADDILFMSDLVTRHGRLVMGAPSSPSLTNVMMFNYDRKFSELAQIHDAKYTRYADDLFFSVASHGALLGIKTSVEEIVESSKTPRLKLNTDKTAYLSKRNKRTITGMIITSDGEASLGRERKRKIKSLLYQAITGKLEKVRLAEVSGLINWSKAADPAFVLSLYKKYGIDAVDRFTGGNRLHQRAGRKP